MAKVQGTNWQERNRAAWMGDFVNRDHLVPGGFRLSTAGFPREDGVTLTVSDAAADTGEDDIDIVAAEGPIPTGSVLKNAAGKYVELTSAVAVDDENIDVVALPFDVADASELVYEGTKLKVIKAGTPVGRTKAEQLAGDPLGPGDAADDEFYLLAFDVIVEEGQTEADAVAYRPGSIVKINFLPDWDATAEAVPTLDAKIRATYQCVIGES